MSQQSNISTVLNSFLDPKLHQVIGSTPESLKIAIEACGIAGNSTLGVKMIAIAVFASSVNKSTVEAFFIEEKFSDLRIMVSKAVTLNGKINMTALSLAGHCFMTLDILSGTSYVVEFRKKIGQNSIWDGPLAAGSISDKQRDILKEKAKLHKRESAASFANWFISYTGIAKVQPIAAKTDAITGGLTGARTITQILQSSTPGNAAYSIPSHLTSYYIGTRGKTQADLDAMVTKYGVDEAINKITESMNRRLAGQDDTMTMA
jgi:hypothetical protein